MATQKKFTELPTTTTALSSDYIHVFRSGTDEKITVENLGQGTHTYNTAVSGTAATALNGSLSAGSWASFTGNDADLSYPYAILSAGTNSAELVKITNVSGTTYTASGTGAHADNAAIIFLDNFEVFGKHFGALADGSTNDYAAIIRALENANSVTLGSWSTVNDVAASDRVKTTTVLQNGVHRIDQKVIVTAHSVTIAGQFNDNLGGGTWKKGNTEIEASTTNTDPIFELNSTYNYDYFGMRNIALRRQTSGNGAGISSINGVWRRGIYINACDIREQDNAIEIAGTNTIANVHLINTQISGNSGYGFYCTRALTISAIERCLITDNTSGGISTGAQGLRVVSNDFEGQDYPIQITGTNNNDLVIEGNYFEAHSVGNACIDVTLCDKFRITNNTYTVNITIPYINLNNCWNGLTDERTAIRVAHNVYVPSFTVSPQTDTLSASWNLRSQGKIPPALNLGGAQVITSNTDTFTLNGTSYNGKAVNASSSWLATSGVLDVGTFTTNDYVIAAFYYHYTDDVPAAGHNFLIYGRRTSDSVYEQCASDPGGFDLSSGGVAPVRVNDTLFYIIGAKVTGANTYDRLRLYMYPYGGSGNTGDGAVVSNPAVLIQSSADFDWFSPIDDIAT
jgi:hypothetical protein